MKYPSKAVCDYSPLRYACFMAWVIPLACIAGLALWPLIVWFSYFYQRRELRNRRLHSPFSGS